MANLASFHNVHEGETIIVCGCGTSLNDFAHPERFITIGVNDVGRRFHPDYLVVVNPRSQFSGDRFSYVENSKAKCIFTQLELGVQHPNVVRFGLGKRGGTDFSITNVLHYTQNSPYVAVCLAVHMGAKRIGLIGVDFTHDHFFGRTGQHHLANQLTRIDEEYRTLGKELSKLGIEVVNLSEHSRITAFKKGSIEAIENMSKGSERSEAIARSKTCRIFFVHYKFLSCGDVFRHALDHAAADLGIESSQAYWDDQELPDKVRAFEPDLLFVVHGRNFSKKWGSHFQDLRTAVWLLDEPYEVDDTTRFSGGFTTVFVNDPSTIQRHQNAHYLPVGFDPHIYFPESGQKNYEVGFIGGHNLARQSLLETLYRNGVLSYVVGPWQGKNLGQICLSHNIPAPEAARLYRQTKIVINIFRKTHHFNGQRIPAFSLNPRIYEALACGALVVSEYRPELADTFPNLPVFENSRQLLEVVEELLNDDRKYGALQDDCYQRLSEHTYLNRLKKVIDRSLADKSGVHQSGKPDALKGGAEADMSSKTKALRILRDWDDYGGHLEANGNGHIVLRKRNDSRPGSEKGLVSREQYSDVALSFEVNIRTGSGFVAKIHQADRFDQMTNSYHLMCDGNRCYFARHNHIFRTLKVDRDSWQKIRIERKNSLISIYKNSLLQFSFTDQELKKGYAFLGIKGGEVLLRNVAITDLQKNRIQETHVGRAGGINYEILHDFSNPNVPAVSIITTVYNRVGCLENCIKSVRNQTFGDCEQIVVADCPPEETVRQINDLVEREDNGQITFANLKRRYNNWGIAPASVGISLSRGRYVCFLSDDNGYTQEHVETLIGALESDPNLGFVYSSCRYDGRLILNSPVPRPGQIDLGQPIFRRHLFKLHFHDSLPFDILAWDWHMISHLMKKGVRWKHINRPSFLFKLHKYPQFVR